MMVSYYCSIPLLLCGMGETCLPRIAIKVVNIVALKTEQPRKPKREVKEE